MKTLNPKPEYIVKNGKATAVILSIKEYEALIERAEDAQDAKWLRERRKKPMTFRKLDEYLAERAGRA
ncbi:hypothetical protein BH20VER1_BH20VER1_06950 [soil metagenome]